MWSWQNCAPPQEKRHLNPRPEINEILICMNYHDLNDKLKCNFHTFHPVIPFGFLPSLYPAGLGATRRSRIKKENQRIQSQKVADHGEGPGRDTCTRG